MEQGIPFGSEPAAARPSRFRTTGATGRTRKTTDGQLAVPVMARSFAIDADVKGLSDADEGFQAGGDPAVRTPC